MATIKTYLDTRRPKDDGTCPLKLNINIEKRGKVLISTKLWLNPENWENGTIIGRKDKEAMLIIEKYRGEKYLLNILDIYSDADNFMSRTNKNLKQIGEFERIGLGGRKERKPLFSTLSTYWARHTWATIAAGLDIPKETIAAALGHEIGSAVTSIYIDFDQRKVDKANRQVLRTIKSNRPLSTL